jgi:thioesterase domain-containing protein
MNPDELQRYLHEHIPLTKAMGVEIVEATAQGVRLAAPLAPNINHRETVFGGSASAIAILAAWALLTLRLRQEGLLGRVVIQSNSMQYLRPIADRFTATARGPETANWQRFTQTLRRRGRARITLAATLDCRGEKVGAFEGDFVAAAAKAD